MEVMGEVWVKDSFRKKLDGGESTELRRNNRDWDV